MVFGKGFSVHRMFQKALKCPKCGGEMVFAYNVLFKPEFCCLNCRYYEPLEVDC